MRIDMRIILVSSSRSFFNFNDKIKKSKNVNVILEKNWHDKKAKENHGISWTNEKVK